MEEVQRCCWNAEGLPNATAEPQTTTGNSLVIGPNTRCDALGLGPTEGSRLAASDYHCVLLGITFHYLHLFTVILRLYHTR